MNLDNLLKPITVQKYLAELKSRKASPATLKRKEAALRKFADYARLELGIKKAEISPADKVKARFPFSDKLSQLGWELKTKSWQKALPAYFSFVALLALAAGLGIFGYEQFIKKATEQLAYPASLTAPSRILSFQGRLTDSGDTPITAATNFVFNLYSVDTGGTAVWTSNTCSIDPDQDGIFSARLGATSGTGACGPAIATSVFTENTGVWLEVAVAGETLTPRQPIATSAYALNSETLQGFPPGTGTSNILYIDSNGNIGIGVTSPTLDATSSSGTFGITAQALLLQTPNTSDGDITINPDGTGVLNLTFEGASPGGGAGGFVNATNANITSGAMYYGSVASDASGYNLIQLASGSSLTNKFTVDAEGDTYIAGNLGIGTTTPSSLLSVAGGVGIGTTSAASVYHNVATAPDGGLIVEGNVGIGTTAPGYKLEVNGTGYFGSTLTLGNSSDLASFGSTTLGNRTYTEDNYVADAQTFTASIDALDQSLYDVATGTSGIWTDGGDVTYLTSQTDDLALGGTGSGAPLFFDEGNELLTLTNATAGLSFRVNDVTSDTTPFVIDASGNVGIGTTGPQEKLEVGGNILATGQYLQVAGNNAYIELKDNNSDSWKTIFGNLNGLTRIDYYGGDVQFRNEGSTVIMEIDDNGNIGIGTTNPLQKLQVAGDINIESGSGVRINNTATSGEYLRGDGTRFVSSTIQEGDLPTISAAGGWTDDGSNVRLTTVGDLVGIGYADPGTAKLAISGNVGIGTTGPGAKLHVVGPTSSGTTLQIDGGSDNSGPWVVIGGGSGIFENTALRLSDDGGGANNINILDFTHSGASVARIKSTNPSTSATTGAKLILETASDNSGTWNSNQLVLSNNNGNIGIGTTAPGKALQVATTFQANDYYSGDGTQGETATEGGLSFKDGLYVSGSATGIGGSGTATYLPKWTAATTLGDSAIFDDSGNIGIGTTATSAKLDIVGTAEFSSTISAASIGADTDNSVVILNSSGLLKTDEIDPDVWTNVDNYASWTIADDDADTYSIASSDVLRFTSTDGNILTNLTNGDDADENLDLSVRLLKDLVVSSGLTGGGNDILVGADSDVDIKLGGTLTQTTTITLT